jgi:hypothetical protein
MMPFGARDSHLPRNAILTRPVWRSLVCLVVLLSCLWLAQPVQASLPSSAPGTQPLPHDGKVYPLRVEDDDRTEAALLLPDLRTLPPTDLHLQIYNDTEVRRLRFSNTIWNAGPGDLELLGEPAPNTGDVRVEQLIQHRRGEPVKRMTGQFYYNFEHGHWHWDGFAIYEIWSLTPAGQLGERLAVSDKVGYCLIDIETYPDFMGNDMPAKLDAPAPRQFSGCSTTRQGLSAGWTDTYRDHLPGQHVDISHLHDGVYALRSRVDPEGVILELDDTNNAAIVYFRLHGEQIDILNSLELPTDPDFTPQ